MSPGFDNTHGDTGVSLHQLFEDEDRLQKNNAAVRRLARSMPGTAVRSLGYDGDTGTPVRLLAIGTLTAELDYLNYEGEGFAVLIRDAGHYVGLKDCRSFAHLLNTLKKVAAMKSGELRTYLKPAKS